VILKCIGIFKILNVSKSILRANHLTHRVVVFTVGCRPVVKTTVSSLRLLLTDTQRQLLEVIKSKYKPWDEISFHNDLYEREKFAC
jgi:hypothetical protein